MDEIVSEGEVSAACSKVAGEAVLAQGSPALEVAGLQAWYGDRHVLKDVSLTACTGRILAIIGPSGCGKSTLLACLNRSIELAEGARWSGQLRLAGVPTQGWTADKVRERVGLVMQKPTPFPFSVERNITYALRNRGVRKRAQLSAAVEQQLRAVGLYDELAGDVRRSALELSGGQQQRLCIARALAIEPSVLLLDEPCSALDIASTLAVEDVLRRAAKTCAIVIVTHNLAQARRLADDVVCMSGGEVAWEGAVDELFERQYDTVLRPLYGSDLL